LCLPEKLTGQYSALLTVLNSVHVPGANNPNPRVANLTVVLLMWAADFYCSRVVRMMR
jgi:hypothetical protein